MEVNNITTQNMKFSKEISDLIIRIDERQQAHDEMLKNILDQTKKTNGRVSGLENYKDMIVEPCIAQSKKTREDVEKLAKFKDEVVTSTKITRWIVGSIIGFAVAICAFTYNLWIENLSDSIVEKIKAEYNMIN